MRRGCDQGWDEGDEGGGVGDAGEAGEAGNPGHEEGARLRESLTSPQRRHPPPVRLKVPSGNLNWYLRRYCVAALTATLRSSAPAPPLPHKGCRRWRERYATGKTPKRSPTVPMQLAFQGTVGVSLCKHRFHNKPGQIYGEREGSRHQWEGAWHL